MSIDKTTVSKIAHLARIMVADEQLQGLADELSSILSWVESLNRLDTDKTEPLSSVTGNQLPMRDDVVDDGEIAEQILAGAPEKISNFFVVPKVIE